MGLTETKQIHFVNKEKNSETVNSVNINEPISNFRQSILTFCQQIQKVVPGIPQFIPNMKACTEKLKQSFLVSNEISKVCNSFLLDRFDSHRNTVRESFRKFVLSCKLHDTNGDQKTLFSFTEDRKRLVSSIKAWVNEGNILRENSLNPTAMVDFTRDKELSNYLQHVRMSLYIESINQIWFYVNYRAIKEMNNDKMSTVKRTKNVHCIIVVELATSHDNYHSSVIHQLDGIMHSWCVVTKEDKKETVWLGKEKEIQILCENRKVVHLINNTNTISIMKINDKVVATLSLVGSELFVNFWYTHNYQKINGIVTNVGLINYIPHLVYIDKERIGVALSGSITVYSIFPFDYRVKNNDNFYLKEKEIIHLPPPKGFYEKPKEEKNVKPRKGSEPVKPIKLLIQTKKKPSEGIDEYSDPLSITRIRSKINCGTPAYISTNNPKTIYESDKPFESEPFDNLNTSQNPNLNTKKSYRATTEFGDKSEDLKEFEN